MNRRQRRTRDHQKEFDSYLSRFRRRYKLRIIFTAIAALLFSILVISLFTAVLKNSLADSNWLYYPARALLVVLPVAVFFAVLWKPYQKFKKSAGADELEDAVPQFGGRVDTYLDLKRRKVDSPFVGLLARDASRAAATAPVKSVVPSSEVAGPVFASVAMLAMAGWMFTAIPLDWRASMKQLWMGWFVSDILPERSIAITPGDTKIRIGDSLFITAKTDGFESGFAELHVKNAEQPDADWEAVSMNPQADGSFAFTLYGVAEPLEYYVSSSFTESDHANVEVVVPAKITSITHDYRYPEWTGLEPTSIADATDIQAVEGTIVDVIFETNKPLEKAALLHDEITIDAEAVSDTSYKASLQVKADGEYRIFELQDDSRIPLSTTYRLSLIHI